MTDGDFELPAELDVTLLRCIDAHCTDFDRHWRAGQAPRIEDFLERIPAAGRGRGLCDLVEIEIELRNRAGEPIVIENYLARFPGQEAIVKQAFAHADVTRLVPDRAPDAGSHSIPAPDLDDIKPIKLGRFEIQKRIGKGGFGIVYLATDPQFPRLVALKVPRVERVQTREQREAFIRDARIAAAVNHPGVVTIYEIDTTGVLPFIVQEYMPGGDLKQRLAAGSLSRELAVAWMIQIAEVVAAAHQKHTFHRDLKPANILLDERSQPRVADFGLAVHERDQQSHREEFAGTLPYMSPEQVRRESNRLDGRTDTWSLGVIFYEMLTGRRPFLGSEREVLEQIKYRDPRPPRELNAKLPPELERICLKCLEKPVGRRYSSANDLADDLRQWLLDEQRAEHKRHTPARQPADGQRQEQSARTEEPARTDNPPRIVPKGLRSFDARDAEFFLSLLPGPRDRHGLPESVRFWKALIEETDASQTFAIGVLHGPSGCGKSSFLKAGVIPILAAHVAPVFVEATAADTEVRLFRGLRKLLPEIPNDLALPEVLAGIRDGIWKPPQNKVLIVLDQFEQWLHAGNLRGQSQLVDALRHCDGEHLQCLILVREDFWTGISRFMERLEIPIQEQKNAALLDRFDLLHARRVLAKFGSAFGRLPENLAELTPQQEQFLDKAIEQLSEEGSVICVRLALFGDLIKGKPWTQSVLKQAGGAEGLGVTFLEDTFAAKSAPEVYRRHEQAVRKLFRKLLPDAGSDIKGSMQSRAALLEACGYGSRPAAFDELVMILDDQLRLVTPTDPEGDREFNPQSDDKSGMPSQYYQLTHDYLVPSLQTWLTRKQAERLRGRAELRLANVAAYWGANPDNKRLPGTWEYVGIRLLTNAAAWSANERKVMHAAARFHGLRWALRFAAMTLLAFATWNFVSDQNNRLVHERIEKHRREAELLVNAAINAPAAAVPYAARNIEPVWEYARPYVLQWYDDTGADPAQRLRAAVLLTQFGEPRMEHLLAAIESADRHECPNVVAGLKSCGDSVLGPLHALVERATSQQNWRLKARLAVTLLQLGDTATAREMLRLGADPIERVTLIDATPEWHSSVERLLESAAEPDSSAFRSGIILGIGSIPTDDLSPTDLRAAAQVLARWYRNMPDAGTHSAAGWALRRWQWPLPELDLSANDARDWHVNSIGLTMVKVPPSDGLPGTGQQRTANSSAPVLPGFWLSDREISRRMFQMFIDDATCPESAKPANWPGADLARSPSSEHPVQKVSWIDAVLFCNWLSRQEHRTESYAWDGTAWQLVSGAGGYRLPAEAEWEPACRAGTTTEFVSGNEERFLASYAVYQSNQTAPCGSKMPNPWGLFDVHGNVYEWCQDLIIEDGERALRSGAFDYSSFKARAAYRTANFSNYRSYTVGIRVARKGD